MIKAFRHEDDIDELVANSYVIGKTGGACLIVDMGDDGNGEIKYIKANFKKVAAVFLTHAHIDHFRGVGHLLQSFANQDIPVYLHEDDYLTLMDSSSSLAPKGFEVSFDPVLVKDDQLLEIGDEKIKVIHTPFHTPGSCCYLMEEENALFTGDTLFKGSIGRTDLPKGDAEAVVPSLMKLKRLSSLLVCYPGHGDITKLDNEKKNNPFLQ